MKYHLYRPPILRCVFFIAAAIALLGPVGWAQTPATPPPEAATAAETPAGEAQHISIDFNNVDITVFIKFISELTGKNFLVDPSVKGKVTIISPNKISLSEAYKVFESVLEIHGFTPVQSGEVIKIIPQPQARSKSIDTLLQEEVFESEDKVVTQLIPLKYADVDRIRALLTPLISKSSVLLAYPETNTLILTDIYSNILRLLRIIKKIDVMGIGLELSVVPLENADAAKMQKILAGVFKTARKTKKKAATQTAPTFVADERTNALIIQASEVETLRIKRLIELLDNETPKGSEKIRVHYLEHANAEDLATVLQEIPSKDKDGKQSKGKAAVVSDKVRITADKSTNSLIIMAEKDDYAILEEVINQLDIPRAMVYIESLLMEVDIEKDFTIGTEWRAFERVSIDGRPGVAGAGFSGASDFSNIGGLVAPSSGSSTLPSGFSVGVFSKVLEIGGIKFPSLAAVAQAFKKDRDIHILSTPQVLTTDNEEAVITIGKNVPFQTRSAAEVGLQTYQSFEYRDVGITLKITPQISKDRMVRLSIDQEITKLDELTTVNPDRPSTFKRTIQTTVIIDDKSTVVIGGLIDVGISESQTSVPCLGDIPGLGWLFKTRSTGTEKTNLFIFLTPHVVQNPEEAVDLYYEKSGNFGGAEGGNIKLYPSGAEKYKIETIPGMTLPGKRPDDAKKEGAATPGKPAAKSKTDEPASGKPTATPKADKPTPAPAPKKGPPPSIPSMPDPRY